ncbi:DUF7679 family protein [Limosilactobacillus kribbianus]|uniref:DUF7679 family protein n=1 Tax=Limosilactobacillus kribbianus TaxID=2982695 RepID=UPI0022653FD8|nr:hypothetical protein [Limosilactobacillus kribbianus]
MDTRDWSFAQRALAEKKQDEVKHHHHRRHKPKKVYWVQVRFTDGRIANYQLPRDLQQALHQHIQEHPHHWQEVLLGALINVPVSDYCDSKAKIKPAVIQRVLILPVAAHNPRWTTRSQFVLPDYSWWRWLFYPPRLDHEKNFLTHDFSAANQQRIRATVDDYRRQQIRWHWQRTGRYIGLAVLCLLIAGILMAI